jgi:hypothetical protein
MADPGKAGVIEKEIELDVSHLPIEAKGADGGARSPS